MADFYKVDLNGYTHDLPIMPIGNIKICFFNLHGAQELTEHCVYKTIGTDRAAGEAFILWCAKFAEANQMNITITVSDDPALASEEVKKFL